MFPATTFILLLLICGTTVCHSENTALTSRFRRQSQSQNANDWRHSPSKQTNKSLLEETIRSTFIISNSSGVELFNTTHIHTEHVVNTSHFPQDQSLDEKQEFKVQRNPDGKLNIVFNDAFLSQTPVPPGSTTGGETKTSPPGREKDIYFPDEVGIDVKCKQGGKSFCTEVQNYPAQELETVLKDQLSKFDILFGDDDIQQPTNITQRTDPNESPLCESAEKVVYPKLAESKDLKWLLIVNVPNYTQGVKIEECLNEKSPCSFSDHFPGGYTTQCKQNYAFRQLVAMTVDRQVIKDLFKFPSCCKCIYKQV